MIDPRDPRVQRIIDLLTALLSERVGDARFDATRPYVSGDAVSVNLDFRGEGGFFTCPALFPVAYLSEMKDKELVEWMKSCLCAAEDELREYLEEVG